MVPKPLEGQDRHKDVEVPVHSSSQEAQPEPAQDRSDREASAGSVEIWRDRALRLQAEMENYRKRQRRLAQDLITQERERLLQRFLEVADELERALTAQQTDVDSLRQGVELTYRSLMKLLEQEDVEPVAALGLPFNPEWHEAVGATTETSSGVPPQTVVEVLRPGYRLGNHLLRPARVIVST